MNAPLTVVLWKWSQPDARVIYRSEHVNTIAEQLRRNLRSLPHRIVCVTDNPAGLKGLDAVYPLWPDCGDMENASGGKLPSCYRRLKLYDPATQASLGISEGSQVLSLDVDSAIIGDLSKLLQECNGWRFMGWARPGDKHETVFNGSFQLFHAGDLSEIWTEFHRDPKAAAQEANKAGFKGSDQAWLSYNLVGKPKCSGLTYPTLASYPMNVNQLRMLDAKVRIVFFHGKLKPWDRQALRQSSWLQRYWGKPA